MADVGHHDDFQRRRRFGHAGGDGGGDQVRQFAAQKQGRPPPRQSAKQQPGDERGQPAGPGENSRNGGIVIELGPVGAVAEGAAGKAVPVAVGERRQRGAVGPAEVIGRVPPIIDRGALAGVAQDPGHPLRRDFRTGIVEDGGGHQFRAAGGQHHGDDAAHRGAEEDRLVDAEHVEQRGDVGRIDLGMIMARVGIPGRQAPSAHVGGNHSPPGRRDPRRHVLEILRIAGQAVQADDGKALLPVAAGIVAGEQRQPVARRPPPLAIRGHEAPQYRAVNRRVKVRGAP